MLGQVILGTLQPRRYRSSRGAPLLNRHLVYKRQRFYEHLKNNKEPYLDHEYSAVEINPFSNSGNDKSVVDRSCFKSWLHACSPEKIWPVSESTLYRKGSVPWVVCHALCENLLYFKTYSVESEKTTFPLNLPPIVRHLCARVCCLCERIFFVTFYNNNINFCHFGYAFISGIHVIED